VITYLSYKQKQYKVEEESGPLFFDESTSKARSTATETWW